MEPEGPLPCSQESADTLCNISNLLTPWSRVSLENVTVTQLVKKFPAFCGTRKFITLFTRDRNFSFLNQMYPVHIFPTYFPQILCNIILPSTPRSSEWSLPFRFSNHNNVSIFSSLPCVLHVPPIPSSLILFREAYFL